MSSSSISRLPFIAIVGRPNVGKSSLFNRLVQERIAITSEIAGTTRDRVYRRAEIAGKPVILVDTGGLEYGKKDNIEADVQQQVTLALEEADLILFVVDAKDGLTIEDHEAAKKLRKSQRKVLLVANKIDSKKSVETYNELLQLGFGEPIEISAYHNLQIGVLEEAVVEILESINPPKPQKKKAKKKENNEFEGEGAEEEEKMREDVETPPLTISFLGKPNVGKSSLVNALLGKTQVIVSNIPGTTRDAIDLPITWKKNEMILIDTAGLRRRGKIERGLEKLSSFRSLNAIERSEVVCLIMDYKEGIRSQDQHIASYILEAGKGLILVINKSDLMENQQEEEMRMIRILRHRFDFLPWASVVFVSALNKTNIEKILEIAMEIHSERFRRIPQEELTEFMKEITYKHLPPPVGNRLPKFYNLEQDAVNPPSFVYWVNDANAIHFSYRRYLENELRKKYGFQGTSLGIYFKKRRSDGGNK